MTLDIDRCRADTPGTSSRVHLNNAGASPPPDPVMRAVTDHLSLEARIGGYEAAAEAAPALAAFYDNVARLVGGRPDEIAYVENATRAWDMAFHGIRWQRGDRILTHAAEYGSNYIAFLQVAQRFGVEVVPIASDADGAIDVAALDAAVDGRTRLIALTHVPTNGGLVNPAAAVGAVARRHGVAYLLDACQSVGQMPVDVATIGCDMLSATGRKFLRGPRGTGFLWVRSTMIDRLDPPFLDIRSAEWLSRDRYAPAPGARRFECFEGFVAGKIGLGRAVAYALDLGLPAIAERVQGLAGRLREGLAGLPGVQVRDLGRQRAAIVTFTVVGRPADAVVAGLAGHGINASVSSVGATRLDMEARGLDALVRLSPHYFNTEDEIDRAVSTVGDSLPN